jgi:DNA-binding transcriptional LysR family regulator
LLLDFIDRFVEQTPELVFSEVAGNTRDLVSAVHHDERGRIVDAFDRGEIRRSRGVNIDLAQRQQLRFVGLRVRDPYFAIPTRAIRTPDLAEHDELVCARAPGREPSNSGKHESGRQPVNATGSPPLGAERTRMQRSRRDELISSLSCALMRTFVRVVEVGGITRAAESLHLAQSAVSAQMSTLAQLSGGVLLERRDGRMVPTALGREVYAACIDVLARITALDARLRAAETDRDHIVKLACTMTVCDNMLARAVALFGRHRPDVTVVVETGTIRDALHGLREGRYDIAFLEGTLEEAGIDVIPFHIDRLRLAMPADDPLAASEDAVDFERIVRRAFIMPPRGSGTRRLIEERLGSRFELLTVTMELQSNDAIAACVEERLGLAFMSEGALLRPPALGTLVARDVNGVDLSREFAAAVRAGHGPGDGARTFLEYLRNGYDADRRGPQAAVAQVS